MNQKKGSYGPATRRVLCAIGWAALGLVFSFQSFAQPFTFYLVGHNLPGVSYSALSIADADGNGWMDVAAGGNRTVMGNYEPVSFVGMGYGLRPDVSFEEYTYETEILPRALWLGSTTWTDFDRDGDLDLYMHGSSRADYPLDVSSAMWRNDVAGFQSVDVGLPGTFGGRTAWADIDNDGDQDALVIGSTASNQYMTALYANESGTFVGFRTNFPSLAYGDAVWGDYDNDMDVDLLYSGVNVSGGYETNLYRNDGAVTFTLVATFEGLVYSALDWGDFDMDGDLDFVQAGARIDHDAVFIGVCAVYRNDGGTFTMYSALDGLLAGDVAWGDWDNDGDLDLITNGADTALGTFFTQLYRNENGTFRRAGELTGTRSGNVIPADIDGDLDLDLVLTGVSKNVQALTNVYRNDRREVNTRPAAPEGLSSTKTDGTVVLSWQAGSDEQTAAGGLTYNVRVGTTPGGTNVVNPAADPENGDRWISARGNTDHNTRWLLRALPAGTYYWSVQAVDGSFAGSLFASEQTFSVSPSDGHQTDVDTGSELPLTTTLLQNYPNPFNGSTRIVYELSSRMDVEIQVFDLLGNRIVELGRGAFDAGRHELTWNGLGRTGQPCPSGVYVLRLTAGSASYSRKMVIVH